MSGLLPYTFGLVQLLAFCYTAGVPMRFAHVDGQREAHRAVSLLAVNEVSDDSIDVLMFGIPRITTLVVKPTDARPYTITSNGDSIDVRSERTSRLTIGAAHGLELSSGKRGRIVTGTVTVRAHEGSMVVVARMAIDEYLAGVISAEARADDPREYLLALSVLQRNYVATHRGRHSPDADLCDNTHCQLFHGNATSPRMLAVVVDASHMTLHHEASYPCYFSANCGGSSLTPAAVWGAPESGYASVKCDECRNSRWHRWTRSIAATPSAIALLSAAPPRPFVDDDFKIRVGRALGFDLVPSNTIDRIERRGRTYRISGRGFGHRVGLCQDGARELALRGQSARQILARYFPGATVATITGLQQ